MKQVKNTKTAVKKSATPAVAARETLATKTVAPVVAKPQPQPVKPATPAVATQPTLPTPPVKPAAPVVARQETPSVKPATVTRPVTIIEAKIDVGFGNHLFVRGQGAGLSWERGTPLTCVGADTWRLAVEATDRLQFKLLLNDRVWAKGEDVVVTPGKQVEVRPAFSE